MSRGVGDMSSEMRGALAHALRCRVARWLRAMAARIDAPVEATITEAAYLRALTQIEARSMDMARAAEGRWRHG